MSRAAIARAALARAIRALRAAAPLPLLALATTACLPRARAPDPVPPPAIAPAPTVAPAPTIAPAPTVAPARTVEPAPVVGDELRGNATWYGARLAGHKTASGERFDPSAMTAAHKTLPLGTWVDVRRAGTQRVVRVRINDRGPFGTPDKVIDLSSAAFAKLGSIKEGVIPVEITVVTR